MFNITTSHFPNPQNAIALLPTQKRSPFFPHKSDRFRDNSPMTAIALLPTKKPSLFSHKKGDRTDKSQKAIALLPTKDRSPSSYFHAIALLFTLISHHICCVYLSRTIEPPLVRQNLKLYN
jgi:hypothetical protein